MDTLSVIFDLGRLYQTSRIFDACCEHRPFHRFVQRSLGRYISCDWLDDCSDDAALNDAAVTDGSRIFAMYYIPPGLYELESKIWIITEADRSCTTVLFPSEY